MASTGTYLNFANNTEEAFLFYQSVFGGEFIGGISRFDGMPTMEGQPPLPDSLKDKVMHVALAITGGHLLMGTDAPAEFGFTVTMGNNVHISLDPDTKEECDTLFAALSAGGKVTQPLADMFWGAYFGSCTDKFGVHWMVNFRNPQP